MLSELVIDHSHWVRSYGPVWPCLIATIAFALMAFIARAVTRVGAVAGAVVCFLLCAGAGFPALAALMAVFVMAWLSTKIGYPKKLKFGTAEKIGGSNALQVFANLGVAAFCAGIYAFTISPILLLAIAASLAEAAADTVSSEVGQLSTEKVHLITSWAEVPAGTDGGVTALGTVSGLAAALAVSAVCVAGRMVPLKRIGIPIIAALCGTVADSFLGALFERKKLMNNDLVNFLGTLIAALIATAA
ncbi:MAG: DUF92 domain-containing protein [Terriglobales bacterium]